MEIRNVLITHLDCVPKSGASNPHNLKCRIPPVSLARPRPYLYSNTGISIKNRVRRKALTRHTLGHQKSRGLTFFFAVARNFKENVSRAGNEYLRSWCPRVALPTAARDFGWVCGAPPARAYIHTSCAVYLRTPLCRLNTHKAYTKTLFS